MNSPLSGAHPKYLKRLPSDLKASRVSVKLVRQDSRFFGNISLIKVNIKTINQVTNMLPLENDTFGTIRERLFGFIEKTGGFNVPDRIKESFAFQLHKEILPREDEKLSIEGLLNQRWKGNEQVFQGDVLQINFFIPDVDIEYEMIRDNLEKLKTPCVPLIFLVKQHRPQKDTMKNILLRIEENKDNCLLTVYSVRGDLKEAFTIDTVQVEPLEQTDIKGVRYYPVVLSKSLEYSRDSDDQSSVSEEKAYFISEKERADFIKNVSDIQEIQNKSIEDDDSDNLIGSIQALGSFGSEDIDEAVKIGKLTHRSTLLTLRGGGGLVRSIGNPTNVSCKFPTEVKTERNRTTTEDEKNHFVTYTMTDEPRFLKNISTTSKKSLCKAKRMSVFAQLENHQRASVISKVMNERKEIELDAHEFEVQIKGMFGMHQKRILRLSEDFEFHFFKREKEKYVFTQCVPVSNIVRVAPKDSTSNKVYIFLKDDKKQQKPLKLTFKHLKDVTEFVQMSKRISDLFNTSTNSFQTEKVRRNSEKVYPWLMGPKDVTTNIEYDQGKLVTMQFNVINLSNSQEPQVVHLDLVTSVLSLISANGNIKKKLNIRNINYLEPRLKDPRGLNIVLKNKKYKLLFSDMRSRMMFESAIYTTIVPQFRIPSKQPFEWETFSVFCTTFNAGFGTPPADLDPWLGKTKSCEIIAIGMQEADTAEWLQAVQEYYFSEQYNLVALVTMWKMLLCVFVSSKYSPYVTNVEVDSKATGIGKVIGNKGGVALSFRLLETSFCFLSCHLAAQPENMPTRKANFYNLMKSIRLGDESLEVCGMFDYFFFMGDTNFRVDYDFYKAIDAISAGNHTNLLAHDQYAKAMDLDNFMSIFKEGKIAFKPTYRRIRDNVGYSNKRNQCPSWTDRIFVKTRPSHPVSIKEYDSAEMFFLSDHRPVYGIYKCEIEPPYLPRIPLYSRPADQQGIIKFSNLELLYDFDLYGKMADYEGPISLPLTISVEFRSKFLQKAASTVPIELKSIPTDTLSWNEEMLPFLYCLIPDYRYLRSESLLAVIKLCSKEKCEDEFIVAQADIPLESLIMNSGTKTGFKSTLYLYGRRFGAMGGNLIYNFS